jgi:lysophospholipase L1-like esterase
MKDGDYSYRIDPDKLYQISEFVIRFADEHELELIDIYDITSGHPEWYEPDKVHPNKHGAKAIAASVFHWIADDI